MKAQNSLPIKDPHTLFSNLNKGIGPDVESLIFYIFSPLGFTRRQAAAAGKCKDYGKTTFQKMCDVFTAGLYIFKSHFINLRRLKHSGGNSSIYLKIKVGYFSVMQKA